MTGMELAAHAADLKSKDDWLVCLAAYMASLETDLAGKILGLWPRISGFVLMGFEVAPVFPLLSAPAAMGRMPGWVLSEASS